MRPSSIKLAGFVAIAIQALACNTILGIDKATFDPTVDSGADAANVDPNSCRAYCRTMGANCSGANQAYTSINTCELVCATYETGVAGEQSNDSLACRITRAKDTTTNPATTCPKAGALATECTEPCAAFCAQASTLCKPLGLFNYASVAECKTACATWPYVKAGGVGPGGDLVFSNGNTLNCRLYHLQSAYEGTATSARTHCPHTDVVSATCN
jgi:hypothetical protein